VPLSEHEQRILRQIERQLQHEHWLARFLKAPDDHRSAARNAKRASAGFVLGLLALSLSFASSWVVGLVGFVIMLASAVTLVQCLRRLAQERLSRLHSDHGDKTGPQPLGGRSHRGQGGLGGKWWAGRGNSGEDEGFGSG
jgi:hypothetical protein